LQLIKFKDVQKVYRNGLEAVSKTSFAVDKGEKFGLLGPNGAGKSSLFNIGTMTLKRSGGDVKLLNIPIDSKKLTKVGA